MPFTRNSQTDHLLKQALEEVGRRRVAQEEAERANRAKGIFMAYLSHEIRNPLAVIMGSADMMSFTPDPDKQQRHMDSMRVASHGLSNLLDDVIDFASLEQDQLIVRREHLWMEPLVRQIVELYSIKAEQKKAWPSAFRAWRMPRWWEMWVAFARC